LIRLAVSAPRLQCYPLRAVPPLIFLALLISLISCGGGGDEENPFGLKSEVVVSAARPITMTFATDGRLFYGEHETGDIRIIMPDGTALTEPFAHLDVQIGIEWGLTGLALDPQFQSNHYVYAYFTQPVRPGSPGAQVIARPVVTRFTDSQNKGEDPTIIVGDLPETDPKHPGYNANGRIAFGPDGYLYISVGDYDSPSKFDPQDLKDLQGKLLRVKKDDGSPAPGNPFLNDPDADPRVYAYGFREAFDFIFFPNGMQLYGDDDTPVSCEELNLIRKGGNYGYPNVGDFPYSECGFGTQEKAIHYFAKEKTKPGDFLSTVSVSGFAFVSGQNYPPLGDGLLVCEAETKLMRRLTLAGTNHDQVAAEDTAIKDCNMDVATSPDGKVFYSNDKEIRRLVQGETPKKE